MEIHTGRAKGIDTLLDEFGALNGFDIYHHSFRGIQNPVKGRVIEYSFEQLQTQEPMLSEVCQFLKRPYPNENFLIECLLLRNMYIEQNSELVFAVCNTRHSQANLSLQDIEGGSIYACTAGFLHCKKVILFSLTTKSFFCLDGLEFLPLNIDQFILSEKKIGGVGTRDLSDENSNLAWKAIKDFFSKAKTT